MGLEKIVNFLNREKEWVAGMGCYFSLKALECSTTLLHVKEYGLQTENNLLARWMMESLGAECGLFCQSAFFGALFVYATYAINRRKKQLGTRLTYMGCYIAGFLASTNLAEYFSK